MRGRPGPDAGRRGALWRSAAWAAPFAVGMALRLYHLNRQLLTGDELHTVNGSLSRSVGEILSNWTYHGADYCVPLTALFRQLMDAGLVLDETAFRTPSLIAAAVLLAAAPLVLRPRLGSRAALVFAWLLAISPMLALYGRIVRSYSLWILLAPAAALAFERWWTRGSRGAAGAFVALGAVSIWLHLGSVPFLLSCFVWAAASAARGGRERRDRLPGLALVGLGLVAAAAVLLLPARASLLDLVGLHGGGRPPILRTWALVTRLQSGTASVPLTVVVVLALLRGAWILAARDRDFALYLGVLAVGHVVGLFFLSPNFLHAAIVANRYVLILLPFALALVALGLAAPHPRVPRSLHLAALPVLLVVLFASGPLASDEYRWSSFTHTQPFLLFTRPGDVVPDERVPRFYRELPPGDEPLLEAPWANVGTHSFEAYQRVHRHPVRVASTNPLHDDARVAFRNTVPMRSDAILSSGARWVVVHRDLRSEEQFVETQELRHAERLQSLPELWQMLRAAAVRIGDGLDAALGPADTSDARLRVWDLSRAPADRTR